jgi:DNA-binding NarL/FixJ family response regulator
LDIEDSRPLTAAVFIPSDQTQAPAQRAIFGSEFSEVAFLVTDHDWMIEYASRDIESVLGGEPGQLVGKALIGTVRPAMASDFLLSITRATMTKRTVMTHAELRGDSRWRHCICLISTLCDHSPPKLGLAIISAGDDPEAPKPSRAAKLEQHLWRIAVEVLAAGLLPPVHDTLAIDRTGDFAELTSHQFEITMRLVSGERVPGIAKDMHLSPSTVRNHLSAFFRRFGVHSQGELISLLRNPRQPP